MLSAHLSLVPVSADAAAHTAVALSKWHCVVACHSGGAYIATLVVLKKRLSWTRTLTLLVTLFPNDSSHSSRSALHAVHCRCVAHSCDALTCRADVRRCCAHIRAVGVRCQACARMLCFSRFKMGQGCHRTLLLCSRQGRVPQRSPFPPLAYVSRSELGKGTLCALCRIQRRTCCTRHLRRAHVCAHACRKVLHVAVWPASFCRP